MKTLAAIALALLLVTPTLAHASDPEAETPTVMVIGDSHVERLGPALEARIEELGAEALPSLARRGWSSGRYRRANDLAQVLRDAGQPDVLIVCLGGNDHPYSRTVYARQLGWIVEQAHAAGVREILWVGPASTHLDERARSRRTADNIARNTRWQREILPELAVHWMDSRDFTTEDHGPDGLHFNRRGYAHWSDALIQGWRAPENSAVLSALVADQRSASESDA